MDGDEVVVEILSHERRPTDSGGEYSPQAQVRGVVKNVARFTERFVVCTVDRSNTGLLLPSAISSQNIHFMYR